ncbi:T-complex protein 1 subunit gamma-like [Rosa chinensis]|uniref:T-complex protein 1 subunit gamma-like n=1 Tax=Rosa chinensis TaxID=74649 RepID=UPI001AD94F06|nr:T-complex protein 1 subunit gamma-like [Rosa chinensis]
MRRQMVTRHNIRQLVLLIWGTQILKFKPDVVITEKGLSDLACHYLSKAGVTAIRRLRKTDNNRIAKACGAVIVNRPDELQESDIGTGAGLFEVKKIGDEFFTFIVDCKDPKACTVLLRGPSKDMLNEVERNLQDAMVVARNILKNPKLVPGGGAAELTVSATLKQKNPKLVPRERPNAKSLVTALVLLQKETSLKRKDIISAFVSCIGS